MKYNWASLGLLTAFLTVSSGASADPAVDGGKISCRVSGKTGQGAFSHTMLLDLTSDDAVAAAGGDTSSIASETFGANEVTVNFTIRYYNALNDESSRYYLTTVDVIDILADAQANQSTYVNQKFLPISLTNGAFQIDVTCLKVIVK